MSSHFDVYHCEDSFAYLKDAESHSTDIIITDSPYDEHVHGNMISGTAMKRFVQDVEDGTRKGGAVPKLELDFAPLTNYEFARDLVRVAKRWAINFCSVEDFGNFRTVVGKKNYARSGIWYKPNAQGQMSGDRPAAAYEGLAIMHGSYEKKRWHGRGSYGIWKCNGTRGEKERHPNQKPLNLCLMLVAKFTDPGEWILDPFCGSGRIGEAALMLGRNYIGLDNDPLWVEKAKQRLSLVEFGSMDDATAMSMCAMNGTNQGLQHVQETE
jgi:DNA modification methylase